MGVCLSVRFDLGRYHATPWGAHVNAAEVEWPPSPWRILRALYAVARTDVRLHGAQAGIDRGIERLIAAGPPVFVLPAAVAAHTRHFMPPAKGPKRDMVIDGFVALDTEAPLEAWWSTTLAEDEHEALARAVRSIGYLGRSESVCTVELRLGNVPDAPDACPDAEGRAPVLCVTPDAGLETLAQGTHELRKQRRRLPVGAEWQRFQVCERAPVREQPAPPDDRPTAALLRIIGSDRPSAKEAVRIGERLRAALQSQYGTRNGHRASPTFSGRRGGEPASNQHRHAHYLTLSDPQSVRADRLLVWAPDGLDPGEVAALAGLRVLRDPSGVTFERDAVVALTALGEVSELVRDELVGPASVWESVTPFGLTRHVRKNRDGVESQIRRELAYRGLDPLRVELLPGPWHEHRHQRLGPRRGAALGVFGARIEFSEPVFGPICVGALSHFGLGLFAPAGRT